MKAIDYIKEHIGDTITIEEITDWRKNMKPKSPMSIELYEIMLDKGYSEQFSDLITQNLNTDFTAGRMIGYLSHYASLPEVEVVDEMLAILSERNQIMQKKNMEATNSKWNQMMNEGFDN